MSRWLLAVVALLSLSSLVGCGPTTKDKLTGKWSGKIEVDRAAMEKKIAEQSDNPIQAALVKGLLETIADGAVFDADLKADGTMSRHLKAGPKEEHKTGTWAVKSTDGDKVTLSLVEDGKPREEVVILTENGFIMEAQGENVGLGRIVFVKAK